MVYKKSILLQNLKFKEVKSMSKKALMSISILISILLLPFHAVTFAAEWYEMDPGQEINNDFYSVWGSGADNVYAAGTFGIKLYYDGNPAGTWENQGDELSG
jgi:hypothetical protein